MQIPSGVILVLAATLPWYVAEFTRHGQPFTDELVFRNMVGRATSHLHDVNGSDDVSFRYYLWQGGYALFGWAGLVPAAIAWWPARRRGGEGLGRALALMWLALAFGLFTAMPTKFHHYIFPALPAAAVLVGVLLDGLLDEPRRIPALGAAALGGAALVLLITRDLARAGVSGEARLLNLVTYNYQRPWPESFPARGPLAAFGVVIAALVAALAVPRVRRRVVIALVGAALAFAVWGLDAYLVRAAPHWGQRALVEAYYQARRSEAEPLVAYSLNWKGENFYTGNHVAVFPAGGGKVLAWIEACRKGGTSTFFFLTEHGRVTALRRELGDPASFLALTDARDNNKFALIKVSYEGAGHASQTQVTAPGAEGVSLRR
jgi:4-amino-4-deoxy-L-arabinose transferase-like glycosyltransferase